LRGSWWAVKMENGNQFGYLGTCLPCWSTSVLFDSNIGIVQYIFSCETGLADYLNTRLAECKNSLSCLLPKLNNGENHAHISQMLHCLQNWQPPRRHIDDANVATSGIHQQAFATTYPK
jgi:hypothetical protein